MYVSVVKVSLVMLGVFFIWSPTALAVSSLLQEVTIDSARLTLAQSRPLVLTFGERRWVVPAVTVRSWFKTSGQGGNQLLQLRPGAIYDYLNVHVSPRVNNLGAKGRFVLEQGKIKELAAGQKGQIVDGEKTSLKIRSALVNGQNTVTVQMKEHRPFPFSASDFASMRFPNLVGRGETSFAGSPRNRVHNIRVATQRYHGLVIMPGEEFSFNHHLGNVDAANGYLPELVIKDNVTTPEYGGGICQVSTTTFRAGMHSGLQITQRRNHSYPVRYYGAPGFDATVYAPSPDLRFKNDFSKPIYLTTHIEGARLIFDVWGTADGRKVQVNGPHTTARHPDGGLTAAIAQVVTKGGKTIREQNFVSRYQSPDKFPTIRRANGE